MTKDYVLERGKKFSDSLYGSGLKGYIAFAEAVSSNKDNNQKHPFSGGKTKRRHRNIRQRNRKSKQYKR